MKVEHSPPATRARSKSTTAAASTSIPQPHKPGFEASIPAHSQKFSTQTEKEIFTEKQQMDKHVNKTDEEADYEISDEEAFVQDDTPVSTPGDSIDASMDVDILESKLGEAKKPKLDDSSTETNNAILKFLMETSRQNQLITAELLALRKEKSVSPTSSKNSRDPPRKFNGKDASNWIESIVHYLDGEPNRDETHLIGIFVSYLDGTFQKWGRKKSWQIDTLSEMIEAFKQEMCTPDKYIALTAADRLLDRTQGKLPVREHYTQFSVDAPDTEFGQPALAFLFLRSLNEELQPKVRADDSVDFKSVQSVLDASYRHEVKKTTINRGDLRERVKFGDSSTQETFNKQVKKFQYPTHGFGLRVGPNANTHDPWGPSSN